MDNASPNPQITPMLLRVRLLDDTPATVDAFGPHQRIADTIHQLVIGMEYGRAIALVGSWGSGKSTVVNLLKTKCSGEEALQVFIFDAWAHEGDPLRRTFLERLIRHLTAVGWLARKKWDERLDDLTKRRKQSTVRSTPQLTTLGTLSAALLFFVPIGLHLLGSPRVLLKIVGAILALGPVLLVGLTWSLKRGWRASAQEGWNVFGLLLRKTEEVTKTETLESPDPTSVEFEAWFRELAQEALQGDRRLLIVLDNLDRVESEDAKKLWTAMRTFLDFPGDSAPGRASKLWTLVPFDPGGIIKLWGDDPKVSDRFIAKTFQVRFTVPFPLLSDWRSFLHEQLKTAFPDHSESEFYTISRIYGTLHGEALPPTPRAIKLFLNETGAVYQTAGGSIPVAHAALSVAVNLADALWTPTASLPEQERLQPFLGAGWRVDLAALYFKMPKEKARQVLYGEAVEQALTEGDGEKLRSLAAIPGIEFVAEQILDQRLATWRDNEPHLLGRVSCALAEAHVPTTQVWENAWSRLIAEVRGKQKWAFLDSKTGKGLAALEVRANDQRFTRGLLDSLHEIPSVESEQKEQKLNQWGDGLLEVLSGITQAGHDSVLQDFFKESGFGATSAQYLSLLGAISQRQDKHNLWRFLQPGMKEKDVIQALVSNVNAGKFDVQAEKACQVMMAVDYKWQWDVLTNALQARFTKGNFPPPEGGAALRTLLRLKESSRAAEQALQNMVTTGWVFSCLQLAFQGNHYETSAACILAALMYEPEANGSSNPGQASAGRNAYRTVVGNPAKYQPIVQETVKLASNLRYGELVLSKRPGIKIARPYVEQVLQNMVARPDAIELFPPATLAGNWPSAREAFDTSLDGLLAVLSEKSNLLEYLAGAEFSVGLAGLYRLVLSKKAAEPLLSATSQHLRGLSRDEWLQGLTQESELLELVEEVQKSLPDIGIGHSLQDALVEIAKGMATGQAAGRLDRPGFDKLLSALSGEQRELVIRHIRDEVIEAGRDMSALLDVFAKALDNCDFLAERADDLVRRGFRQMLDRRIPAELSWVAGVLEICPNLLKQSKSASRSDFKDRVKELLAEESLNAEAARQVEKIGNALKLEKKKE